MICFDEISLKALFETPHKKQIIAKILESKYSLDELLKDKHKAIEIAASVPMIGGKESIEIFTVLYSLLDFYANARICFPLKETVDNNNLQINTLEKLISSIKENGLTDISLMSKDGLRDFQIKSYRGEISSKTLTTFIKSKLLHYGNDLGEVNFLITLKTGGDIPDNFFEELHQEIKEIKIKGTGHILISYNEENQFNVLVTAHPILGHTKVQHKIDLFG